ncbi:aldo/keto reductase [Embleya sp. NPDC050493]|uniref:aldo/keto reductase n=1 Tax=Embleya sp. NPDC050493 TaxID=3363989 RepID=UPI003789BA8F
MGIQSVDTAVNYGGFEAHARLASVAGDLLDRLHVSTKVGFFPTPRGAEHSLDPHRLRAAVEKAARDLGREPDVVLLHSPERSLACLGRNKAKAVFNAACAELTAATGVGLCGEWGIASWDPRCLPPLVDASLPTPDVLMVRAGLLAGIEVLDTADLLAIRWQIDRQRFWGMSPFGGSTTSEVWSRVDPRIFLRDPQSATRIEAAFRVSYHLPGVSRMAVGADDPDHLRALVKSLKVLPHTERLSAYRGGLRARAQQRA